MPVAGVPGIGFLHVIGSAVQPAQAAKPDELAGVIQRHPGAAAGIPGQRHPPHRHAVHGMPFLRPEIQQRELHSRKRPLTPRHHRVQSAILPDARERGIRLRGIADEDPAASRELPGHPGGNRLDHGGMGDQVFPAVRPGIAFVMLFDPIRLQDHPVARPHEVVAQSQSFKRPPHQCADSGRVGVVR